MGKRVKRYLTAFHLEKPLRWLLLITLLGGAFRFYNPNWDYQHSFHPDERNILGQTASVQAGDGYRVHFFAYGQLPVYLYRATGELISTPAFLWNLCRGNEGMSQWLYWFFLAVIFGAAGWALSRKDWSLYSFSAGALLFAGLLFFKFFKIFSIWFDQLSDFPLKGASFLLVLTASLGASLWIAQELEVEWVSIPMYGAAGATAVCGILPLFLPDPVARLLATLAFTLMVAGLGLWWSWKSGWGRALVGLFSLWTLFASLDHAGRQFTGYGECMIIGRVWAAAFSTATIVMVYHFVKRAYENKGMALLASACFAFSVVSIQIAHYCITESLITLMLMVMAWLSYELYLRGGWKEYLLAGAAFGLSMASKTSSLYYVFILITAHLLFLAKTSKKQWRKEDAKQDEKMEFHTGLAVLLLAVVVGVFLGVGWRVRGVFQDLFSQAPNTANLLWITAMVLFSGTGLFLAAWGAMHFKVIRGQMAYWIRLAAAGGLSFFLFVLFSPWSLFDFPKFMESQNYEWHVVSIADACYVLQFKDTPRYLFQLKNLMSVELWWPLGITVVVGALWVIGRFLFQAARPSAKGYLPVPFLEKKAFTFSLHDLLLLVWFIPYFGFIGSWNTKFIRYMVPLIPVFCIFGARFLTDLFEWARKFSWNRFLKPAIWLFVVGPSLFYSIAYMHVYRYQHPWVESSIWIFKNIPTGSKIFNEAWGDGLPVDVSPSQDSRVDRIMGSGLYHSQDITPYEMHGFPTDDSPIKRNYYANLLPTGDYISISSKKLWYTLTDETPEFRPHGYNAYPITSRYYRCLWSGLLGYKMVYEDHNFPSLFGWEHPDDMAEESFSVYDHPRVYIFKKVADVSPERILKLLDSDDYVKGINRDIMRTITPENVDAFIAKQHDYLEKQGLLAQLDAGAPTVTAVANVQEPPTVSTTPAKPSEEPTIVPQNQPTPEIKIQAPATVPGLPDAKTLQVLQDYAKNPVIENDVNNLPPAKEDGLGYQLRAWLSWVIALILLGWMALPLTLRVLSSFPSGAYSLSKIMGFFIFAWVVWFFTSLKICHFTFASCWVWFLLLAALSLFGYWHDQKTIKAAHAKWSKDWMIQEGAFVSMFLLFTFIKMFIPHIHDPGGEGYNGGGEAGMDFGFLASVVRGESFPPQNMWMAGQPIGYTYYYGHLMMGILTKFLGLAPAVTYNLALITLFALIFSCAFGIAFALSGRLYSGWIAGFLCAAAGNPAGAWQYLEALHQCFTSLSLGPLAGHIYDYWGPTRVIPNSINEFPYFSVLYGDLHAHTLAMPFAMLLIAVLGSYYLSPVTKPFDWSKDWVQLLMAGFLLGGVAFLNTFEIPAWLALAGFVLIVRNAGNLRAKTYEKGFGLLLALLVLSLTLLGWVATLVHGFDYQILGGSKYLLLGALALFILVGAFVLFFLKDTSILPQHFATFLVSLAGILLVMRLLWHPFFAHFVPQQSEVLWVTPSLRTSLIHFFGIFGLFVTVLGFGFLVGGQSEIAKWIESKKKWNIETFVEDCLDFVERLIRPQKPVLGMMFIGMVTLLLFWGSSWVHFTDPPDKSIYSLMIGTVAAGVLASAVFFRKVWELWLALLGIGFLWISLLFLNVIHLSEGMPFTLNMGLFSVLWLLAFLNLGLAIKVFKHRALSFTYLLVALFFFILATVEVFVMKEYLGGDYMRNNTLFKFYIVCWELGSVAAGVFLPKIFEVFAFLSKAVRRETPFSIPVLIVTSIGILFLLFRFLLDSFLPSMETNLVYIIDLVLIFLFVVWGWMEDWIEETGLKICIAVVAGILAFSTLLALLPQASYGTVLFIVQRWASSFDAGILFPIILASVVMGILYLVWEGKKNMGSLMVFWSWGSLFAMFAIMVCIYPYAATIRKCHGFLDVFRKQWVGYTENLTLNGLAYIPRESPYDAAAIRFLNDHVPDQPCLLEFVGEGYNSWGSRYSIFTGIPALMGWDGHVREWLTGRAGMDADISQRFQATDQIFKSKDTPYTKKMLDAYGVRLVMVGVVEKYGVPGRKGGYPAEGLAKFSNFLPLIYKNPQVEIYYNPPPTD